MRNSFLYFIIISIILFLDRFTKFYALNNWCKEYKINNCLSFEVLYNKGISWGLLNAQDNSFFVPVSILIILATFVLSFYALKRYNSGFAIFGEILVITGSVSNIIDRFYYGAVIDFIILQKGPFVWPVFNLADVAIVVGVILMFIQMIWYNE